MSDELAGIQKRQTSDLHVIAWSVFAVLAMCGTRDYLITRRAVM